MKDKALQLLGLMRRANAIELGEDNSIEAIRAGKARVVVLASDAADNAAHKVEQLTVGRSAMVIRSPFRRDDLAGQLGIGSCAMVTITDLGFAAAFMKQLSEELPEQYAEAAAALSAKAEKGARRKREKGSAKQAKGTGKTRRTNI